jgi:hypothetical protein
MTADDVREIARLETPPWSATLKNGGKRVLQPEKTINKENATTSR